MPKKANKFIGCSVKDLPQVQLLEAAKTAIDQNPSNRPSGRRLAEVVALLLGDETPRVTVDKPKLIAMMVTKYWGSAGVKLGVTFLDNTNQVLRDRILLHMNAWSDHCNVSFAWSQSQGDIRISRGPGGYWSYLGTDIRHIPAGQPTMNLEGFVMSTPESEYKRVVRHETAHSLGCPHEHARPQIVAKLDPDKTIAYFRANQGWDEATVREQILTPLSESSIRGTPAAEEDSIMCYSFPGACTRDGKPIVGGVDITTDDASFMGKMYPKVLVPTPPVNPPVSSKPRIIIEVDGTVNSAKIVTA